MNTITTTGAQIMVQALCRSFVKNTPWDETPNDWTARALRLQESINRIIGAKATADDITELVTSFEQLESIEAGTHPELIVNETRTADNTLGLTEALMGRINDETWTLLDNSGFNSRPARATGRAA